MKYLLFSVFDTAVKEYLPPFAARSIAEATRSFGEIANDKNHLFGKYPEQFCLYSVGEIEAETGELKINLINLGLGSQYVNKQQPLMQVSNV